jgi:hypothetical protein
LTEERQRAGGRRKKENNLCHQEYKPLNLFMSKDKNMYFETRSARNAMSLLNPLNLFIGIPSALCLLPS